MKKIALILILLLNTAALNAQSFTVFDIDTVSFPVMKAKFYAFDGDYKQLLDLSPDDFEIYEDGVEREVSSVSCPEPAPPTAISSVLVMDVSGSMSGTMLEKAQEAARSWVKALPLGKSECAITSFDTKNNMIQDFIKDRNRLLKKIDLLDAGGGTDYEAGFINPLSGGLLVAKTGKYKKVLVFLTDGRPNFTPDVSAIVAEALKYNVTIFAVTLDMPCPKCLLDIAARTGGSCFENVSTVEEAKEIYMKILQSSQGRGACEIEWESGYNCTSGNTQLETTINTFDLYYITNYTFPSDYIAELQINPEFIYFQNKEPGIKHDTTIIMTAKNADFTVSDISNSNNDFQISPSSFTLEDGTSVELTLNYTPSDSAYTYSEFEIINDICTFECYVAGGFPGIKPKIQTLKLTHPNGGEYFLLGSDTVISWEGIPSNDRVILDYSIDNGNNWLNISDTATGLYHSWCDIHGPVSDSCLVRVSQIARSNVSRDIPTIEWQKNIGGSDNDVPVGIIQTFDNYFLVAGYTDSKDHDVSGNHGKYDFWIVKLNLLGNIEWQKCFGGSKLDYASSIHQTYDRGFIVAGHSSSSDYDVSNNFGKQDGWIVKFNKSGDIEWQKSFGGSLDDYFVDIQQTVDGGYIIAGDTYSNDADFSSHHGSRDVWILKINSIGEIQWQKCYGGSNDDNTRSLQETADGGYIVAGGTNSNDGDVSGFHGSTDSWVLKINSIGDIEWQKCYGGYSSDYATSIKQTTDNGYIIAGITSSSDMNISGYHDRNDFWIVKIDEMGEIQWQKCYGGTGKENNPTINTTYKGGYIVAGISNSNDGDVIDNHGEEDFWIVKINEIGEIQWQKCYGGQNDENTYSNNLHQTFDGGFITAVWSESKNGDLNNNYGDKDIWIVKLSPDDIFLQDDVSDSVFAIVAPEISSIDIDMGQVLVGKTKEKYVTDFIQNIGSWECRIDSIYFRGTDSTAFSLVSGIPQYTVATGASHFAEFGFRPVKVGLHEAKIVIISQSDTLIQNIRGEGIEPKLDVMCDWIDFGQVYLTEHKDTVKAIIENTGTASIEITKTEITGPDLDQFEIIDGGGSFTLAPGDERELTLRFEPAYLGKTSTNLNFYHNESGSPALTQLYGEGIKNEANCDSTGFEYPDFTGVDDIILSGSTGKVEDYIRLTYANTSQAGAIWHEKPVLVGNGFITEFSFRMSSGDNVNTDDGSLPGADGLAFVIQNNEDIQMGLYGGGIGFHGIENALAVEFDLFQNNSKQIIDFKDPNGNHAAIQKSVDNKVSALHSSWNTIEINEDIPELKSDGTVYYAKIEYNIEPNVMSIYLDETGELDDPVIVAGGVKLNDIINLLQDQKAFVGITSATGNAYQIHDLLDWYFCPFPVDITAVENEISRDEITFNIYPNPASESTTIEINNPVYQYVSLSITDIFGREVKSLYSGYKTPGSFTFKWNTSDITDGVYFCRLNLGDETFVKAVVVSR